uniref:Uncharacterized protein n=1 Tax=Rhizophora mucronata TaxID=61149 RepID=A0A2P2QUU0_RHIMU
MHQWTSYYQPHLIDQFNEHYIKKYQDCNFQLFKGKVTISHI